MLLALRAVADGALACFDKKTGREPLVHVEVEGESGERPVPEEEDEGPARDPDGWLRGDHSPSDSPT
jgi:hypothetical protein